MIDTLHIKELLLMKVGENTILALFMAAFVLVVVYVGLRISRHLIVNHVSKITKKTRFEYDDVITEYIRKIHQWVYVLIALFVALQGVHVPDSISLIVHALFLGVVVIQSIALIEDILIKTMERFFMRDGQAGVPSVFRMFIKLALWLVGGLLVLSNLGVNITSLIAGLGIGGIAISLALQSILSDLFSSFSIAIDRPFKEGDFIIVGEHMGTVKNIGLKTTRIQALQGEEIVISNHELTNSRIQNFKKLQRRRVQFAFGLTYDTPPEKLERVGAIVQEVCESLKVAEFDRAHFKSFGDSTLDCEAVYFLNSNDYIVYMETQQSINIGILRKFADEGIEMAFPTRTVYTKELK